MSKSASFVTSNPLKVYMAGSEWFASRAGGLNRYFEGLYNALAVTDGVDAKAFAFGNPPVGGSSWGPLAGSTLQRIARSSRGPRWEASMVMDRHFCLYGSRPRALWNTMPTVVHFHGPWADESAAAGESDAVVHFKRAFEKLRYKHASAYITLSEEFKGILVNKYDVEPERVKVIPPGVDLDQFVIGDTVIARPKVLCVRRLERRMGIDVLLDSWVQVRAVLPDALLTIVGTGKEEAVLKRQSEALGIMDSVEFLGRLSDAELALHYQEATLSVVPSVSLEGFGLIALESLAAGTPPVVTNCGGLPDAVIGLDPSLIVEPGNKEELAARLISAVLGHMPSPADCRQHAETFAWSKVAESHVALYRGIA